MLKENVYILTNDKDEYSSFISGLQTYFGDVELFNKKNSFISRVENHLSESSFAGSRLLILFVEAAYLSSIAGVLAKKFIPTNYILIGFFSGMCTATSEHANIFELIDAGSKDYNMAFFFSKLRLEINNKNTISLLQFEVRKFYEIGKSLSSEKDTMKLFEMIIDSSLNLTSSDAGTIYLVVDRENGSWSSIKGNTYENKLLKFVIAKNLSMDISLETFTSDINKQSIVGYTIATGRSLRVDDAYNLGPELEYRHDRSYDSSTGYKTSSILSIPMKDHENNVMGVIQLINKKKDKTEKLDYSNKSVLKRIIPYDYTDEMIMNSLVGQAAVALENNLLYRDMNDLLQSYKLQNSQLEFLTRKILRAHEEERKRIAREIHDGPAQSVVNLSFKVELGKKYMQSGNYDKLSDELNSLSSNIRSVSKEIRSIIYNLKPSYLEDGLIRALENHFSIFSENTGTEVAFSSSGDDKVIEYYMTSTIYRIVQEAFSNIHKHAEASRVEVSLRIESKSIVLTITDNGKGFDTTILNQKKTRRLEGGFGLEGMEERLELIQGSVSIDSRPGAGTRLTVSIPLLQSV